MMRHPRHFALLLALIPACNAPPAPPDVSFRSGQVAITPGARATEGFSVRHVTHGMEARVRLRGAQDVIAAADGGTTWYANALGDGVHIELRNVVDGVEDFVHFPARPAREELRYQLDMRGVAGLRLVPGTHTLELLDAGGAPRLRMAAPWGQGADGVRFAATTRVEGCAVDESTAPPWGREPTPPGAKTCEVVVSWEEARAPYPAVIDPLWTSAGVMKQNRCDHAAVRLLDGRVLVVAGWQESQNGQNSKPTSLIEAFDPATGTWAIQGNTPWAYGGLAPVNLLKDGRVFIAGGAKNAFFEPATGTITLAPSLPVLDGVFGAAVLPDGRVFATGNGNKTWYTLDVSAGPTATWQPGGTVLPRLRPSIVPLDDGRVLLSDDEWPAEIVNPSTNQTDKPLSQALWGTAAKLADGTALFIHPSWVMRFDPKGDGGKGSTKSVALPGVPRTDFGFAPLPDGRLVVAGGRLAQQPSWTAPYSSVVEVFDPTLESWSQAGMLQVPRARFSLTLLADGGLLAAGGLTSPEISTKTLQSTEVCPDGICAKVTCSTDADCEPGTHCGGGVCVGLTALGGACKLDADCQFGVCAQGTCCETACDGPCITCNAAHKDGTGHGVCGPVREGLNPSGLCKTDGTECGATGSCDGYGLCEIGRAVGTWCSAPSVCKDGQEYLSGCNGSGACVPLILVECSPAKVCGSPSSCGPNQCQDDAGCAAGYLCQGGKCTGDLGTPCEHGCASGHCVDGVCCNTACEGECATCATGTCRPLPAQPPNPFASEHDCSVQFCDGISHKLQFPNVGAVCGPEFRCEASGLRLVSPKGGVCGDNGQCIPSEPPAAIDCFPFVCLDGSLSCQQSCNAKLPDTCAPGAKCVGTGPNAKCVSDGGGGGSGAGGSAGAGGAKQAPSGPGEATPTSASDGCSCRAAGDRASSPRGALALALLALFAGRKRRDRALDRGAVLVRASPS